MAEQIKPDRRIVLTRAMIEQRFPCPDGLRNALQFLPARLSTDPEQNIALACRLACSKRADDGCHDTAWLLVELTGANTWPDESNKSKRSKDYPYNPPWSCPSADPLIIAQTLAMIADYYATKAGR